MTITVANLVIGGIPPKTAFRVCPALVDACARFEINTPAQQGGFVGQCAVESLDFTQAEEQLSYGSVERICAVFRFIKAEEAIGLVRNPEKLANRVYSNRLGNGPPESGDGWRYRGRGFIQITGRANYAQAAETCGLPFLADPDSVAKEVGASQSAAAFWDDHGCSDLATLGEWDRITRIVAGPSMMFARQRAERSAAFAAAFSGV